MSVCIVGVFIVVLIPLSPLLHAGTSQLGAKPECAGEIRLTISHPQQGQHVVKREVGCVLLFEFSTACHVCVRTRMRAYVRACVRVRVCVCVYRDSGFH